MLMTEKKPFALGSKGHIEKKSISILTHTVVVDKTFYKRKPSRQQFASVTMNFHYKGTASKAEALSIEQIAQLHVNGRIVIFADYAWKEADITKRSGKLKQDINFSSSSLIGIDIDDGTPIQTVLEHVKHEAAYLYTTWNHKPDFHKYRIVYQLNRPIVDRLLYKEIILMLHERLESIVPGLKADEGAKDALRIWSIGRDVYEIDYNNVLDANQLEREAAARIEKKLEAKQKRLEREFDGNTPPTAQFTELKLMAEYIGIVPDFHRWIELGLALKHHAVIAEEITEEQGFELFCMLSDSNETEKQWDSFQPKENGGKTIGTFIGYAKKKGFVRTFEHVQFDVKQLPTTELTYNKHISELPQIESVISCAQRVLVDSPTGSGKTYAFIDAMKRAEKKRNEFYIFSCPTRPLTEQVAASYDVVCIIGKSEENLYRQALKGIQNGGKVFVCTYDMTKPLYEILLKIQRTERLTLHLIIDEYHKLLTEYNYRDDAIRSLYEIASGAKTVVGLSGTPQEINAEEFDCKYVFRPAAPIALFNTFKVYRSDKEKSQKDGKVKSEYLKYLKTLTKFRVQNDGCRVLLFLEDKKEILKLRDILRKDGVKVATVTAENKNSRVYESIVKNGTVESDVQVILATSVIADGISILNDSKDWEVIAVVNSFSKLYHAPTLKQISNRLRNPYRTFSLFVRKYSQQDKPKRFNAEGLFRMKKDAANSIISELQNDGYFDIRLFKSGVIERAYGIENDGKLFVDEKKIRHAAYASKRNYLRKSMPLLIAELEAMFSMKSTLFDVDQTLESRLAAEIESVEKQLVEMVENENMTNEQKREFFHRNFSENVFKALKESVETDDIKAFKKNSLPALVKCVEGIAPYTTYEQAQQIALQVDSDRKTHMFRTYLQAVIENMRIATGSRHNKTAEVVRELAKHEKEAYTKEEFTELLQSIAKKTRKHETDVKACLQHFEMLHCRNKKQWKTTIWGLRDIKTMAVAFSIETSELTRIAHQYIELYGDKYDKRIFNSKYSLKTVQLSAM